MMCDAFSAGFTYECDIQYFGPNISINFKGSRIKGFELGNIKKSR